MRRSLPLLLAAAALAGACDHKASAPETQPNATEGAGPAAPAAPAPNTMTIDVPGLKGSIALPNVSLPGNRSDIDGMKLYPGTRITGLAVAGDRTADRSEGGVTLRYTAPAAPGAVLAFYRHAAPDAGFTLGAAAANAMHAAKGGKTAVTIVADAAPGGGSAGTISVSGD